VSKKSIQETTAVIEKLYTIAVAKGTNEKKRLLETFKNDENFKYVLSILFDGLKPFGIAGRKLAKDVGAEAYDVDRDLNICGMFDYLVKNNTGKDENVRYCQCFINSFKDEKIKAGIKMLFLKNFENLGIKAQTINKIYKNLIPEFKLMLCEKLSDNPEAFEGKTFAIQPKLDGYRFVVIKRNGKVQMFSRSGAIIDPKDFPEITAEVLANKNDNFVLDGEKMPLDFMSMDSKQQFKMAAAAQSKGVKKGYCIAVYDIMSVADWDAQKNSESYDVRYEKYQKILKGGKFCFPLPNLYRGEDQNEIEKWFKWAIENEKEGVIVKNVEGVYEFDRTVNCMKVKTIFDYDLKVVGFFEGNGKLKGSCGGLLLDFNGTEIRVGSGLTDALRADIWANKEKYLGKTAEIIAMEEATNKNNNAVKLRLPRFKCFKEGD
jgi:DNA ligase-1